MSDARLVRKFAELTSELAESTVVVANPFGSPDMSDEQASLPGRVGLTTDERDHMRAIARAATDALDANDAGQLASIAKLVRENLAPIIKLIV